MELVSIIVGTYNGSQYIEEQLKSILEQTYSSLEIIIVDDNSSDNTIEIIKEFQKEYSNISLHEFGENVGYIKNFERGISLANGNYIALSDQDDWWMPSKIEVLIHQIKQYDLAYCDSTFVDKNLQELGSSFSATKNLISSQNPLHFLLDNCVSGHAALFKKSLFEKAKPFPVAIPHDWWITYVASLYGGVYYVDQPLVKYRHHDSNVIATKRSSKKTKALKRKEKRNRIYNFYKKCPDHLKNKKKIILNLYKSYNSNIFLVTNIKRGILIGQNRHQLLKIFKKNNFNKMLFILSMFFRIK